MLGRLLDNGTERYAPGSVSAHVIQGRYENILVSGRTLAKSEAIPQSEISAGKRPSSVHSDLQKSFASERRRCQTEKYALSIRPQINVEQNDLLFSDYDKKTVVIVFSRLLQKY